MLNHSSVETLSYILSNLFRIYVMYLFARAYFHDETTVKKIYIILNYSSWSKKNLSNHIITYFKKFFRFHLKSEARV